MLTPINTEGLITTSNKLTKRGKELKGTFAVYLASIGWPTFETWIRFAVLNHEPLYCQACGKILKVRTIGSYENKIACNMECRQVLYEKGLTQGKIRQTMLERFGVEHHAKLPDHDYSKLHTKETRERVLATWKERYGGAPCKSKEILERALETRRRRETAGCYEESKRKARQTMMERYGVEWAGQSAEFREISNRKIREKKLDGREDWIKELFDDTSKLFAYAKEHGIHAAAETSGYTRTGIEYILRRDGYLSGSRPPSMAELKIRDYLLNKGIEFTENDRKTLGGKEIDFLFGDIGIEVNGAYWHSENPLASYKGRSKDYHAKKFENCLKNGIILLQFTDIQIHDDFDFVASVVERTLKRQIVEEAESDNRYGQSALKILSGMKVKERIPPRFQWVYAYMMRESGSYETGELKLWDAGYTVFE